MKPGEVAPRYIGFQIARARFSAIVSWIGFEAPCGEPAPCEEGDLAWMPRDRVLCSPEVVSNIHRFGPEVFAGLPPRRHRFAYRNGAIESYDAAPIGAFPGPVDCR